MLYTRSPSFLKGIVTCSETSSIMPDHADRGRREHGYRGPVKRGLVVETHAALPRFQTPGRPCSVLDGPHKLPVHLGVSRATEVEAVGWPALAAGKGNVSAASATAMAQPCSGSACTGCCSPRSSPGPFLLLLDGHHGRIGGRLVLSVYGAHQCCRIG